MTVNEMIEILKRQNPEMEVEIQGFTGSHRVLEDDIHLGNTVEGKIVKVCISTVLDRPRSCR